MVDQTGQRLAAVDRVQNDALGPGQQLQRFPAGFGHDAVAFADIVVVAFDLTGLDADIQSQKVGGGVGNPRDVLRFSACSIGSA